MVCTLDHNIGFEKEMLRKHHVLENGASKEFCPYIIINPAIIVVILNPSPVTLSETKGLAVQLKTGSVKDLVTA